MEFEIELIILTRNYLDNRTVENKKKLIEEINNTNSLLTISYVYNILKNIDDDLNDILDMLYLKLTKNEKRLVYVL